MFNYLRNIRHNNRAKNFFIWNYLGLIYRLIITWIPFNFSIKQNITPKFTFHLHARFAFSNFREWGNKHNNFFNTYISKANKIKCFFDVGSHIGIVTLPLARTIRSGGKIYAFEPSKNNLFYLKYHLKKNNIENVKIIDKLVTSKNDLNSFFYESGVPTGMNSVIPIKEKKILNLTNVESITLDEFCFRNKVKPDYIKVDVEGSEVDLLKGSKRIMKKYHPTFFLSYHPSHIQKLGYTEKDLFKILKNFNYKIYDNNLKEPKKLRSLEYLILPEKVNPRKFLNVN